MGKDPAFLFYSQDFIVGVQTMNFEDRGKYITILAQMHQQGRLKEETIRFMVGSVSDTLRLKFGIDKDGFWYNKRLEDEMEKRKAFVQSRIENGRKGGRPKKEKPLGKAKTNLPENEIKIKNKDKKETEYEILDPYPFSDFWDLYDKKAGKKEKVQKKWDKLPEKTRKLIMEYIPYYRKAEPNKKYRKNPETFLNNDGWLDEIITGKQNGTSKQDILRAVHKNIANR